MLAESTDIAINKLSGEKYYRIGDVLCELLCLRVRQIVVDGLEILINFER